MSRRFQFSLRTLLGTIALAAAFFAGMFLQKEIDRPQPVTFYANGKVHAHAERTRTSDGTYWYRGSEQGF